MKYKTLLWIIVVLVLGSLSVHAYNAAYNYSTTTNKRAYEKVGIPASPTDYDNEIDSGEYTAISTSNDERLVTSIAGHGEYDSQIFIFNLSQSSGAVSKLNLTWEGYGETQSGRYTNISFWNWQTNAWDEFDAIAFTSAVDQTRYNAITAGASRYVDSTTNQVAVLVTSLDYDCTESMDPNYTSGCDDTEVAGGNMVCGEEETQYWLDNLYYADGGQGTVSNTLQDNSKIYFNYTIPSTVNTATWEYEVQGYFNDGGQDPDEYAYPYGHCWDYNSANWHQLFYWDSASRTRNVVSIPSDCLMGPKLALRFQSEGSNDGRYAYFYEENISWNCPASPFIYSYSGTQLEKISDFTRGASSKDLEYKSYIDVSNYNINNKYNIKITEELDETAYIDNFYLETYDYPAEKESEFNAWFKENFREQDRDTNIRKIKDTNMPEFVTVNKVTDFGNLSDAKISLLSSLDNKYLIMEKGDKVEILFKTPELKQDYIRKAFFVAEGYYESECKESSANNPDSITNTGLTGAPSAELPENHPKLKPDKDLLPIHVIIFILCFIIIPVLINHSIKNKKPVKKFIGKLLHKITKIKAAWPLWFISVLAVMILRNLTENYFEAHRIFISPIMSAYYFLFWPAMFFPLVLLMVYFTKDSIAKVTKTVIVLWWITHIPPIIDVIVSKGTGLHMKYVLKNHLYEIFTFLDLFNINGPVTIGMKIEIFLMVALSCIYVAYKTKSWIKSIAMPISIYAILMIIGNIFAFKEFFRIPNNLYTLYANLIYVIVFGFIWLRLFKKEVPLKLNLSTAGISIKKFWKTFILNLRIERTLHYGLLVILGFALAVFFSKEFVINTYAVFKLISSALAIIFAWQFLVYLNDIFDIDIDRISNKNRPLVKNIISLKGFKVLAGILLLLSLIFAALAGYIVFILVIYYLCLGILYSVPPFRLRKYFLVPNIIISIATVLSIFVGASIVYGDQVFIQLPRSLVLLIFVIYIFVSIIKDLKDYKGDKAANINTVPTLLTLKASRILVGLLVLLSFILIPLFLKLYSIVPFAAIAGIISFAAIYKGKERFVFLMEILFFIFLIFLLLSQASTSLQEGPSITGAAVSDLSPAQTTPPITEPPIPESSFSNQETNNQHNSLYTDFIQLDLEYNSIPSYDSLVLNSTSGNNYTSETLTYRLQNANDGDGDPITNITNWYVDDTSITMLNLPFDGLEKKHADASDSDLIAAWAFEDNLDDFSDNGHDGTFSNYVANPGFELGASANAYSWAESFDADRVSDKVHSETWSMKFINPSGAQATAQGGVNVTPNKDFVLSGWVYHGIVGTAAYLDLDDIPEECHAAATAGNNAWEYVSCPFTTGATRNTLTVRMVVGAGTGNIWFDDISIKQVEQVTGRVESAYDFDGVKSYIDIPASTDFDVQRLTISAWVYSSNYLNDMFIFEKGTVNTQYSLFFGVGDVTIFRTYNAAATIDDLSGSTKALGITNGQWHHVAATYDGNYKRIYVDGVEKASKAYTQTLRTGLGTAERIGAYGGSTPEYHFNGTIDELLVYDRALDANEVASLYRKGIDKDDEAPDYSNNGKAAILGNGTDESKPTWTSSGILGGAYDFDGSDDRMLIINNPQLNSTTGNMSIEVWLNVEGLGSTQTIIEKCKPDTFQRGKACMYNMYLDSVGDITFWRPQFPTNVAGYWTYIKTSSAISTGSWHHIVATTDEGADRMYIYVDGVLSNSGLYNASFQGQDRNTTIGYGWQDYGDFMADFRDGNFFNGTIDEVRIYDRTLSAGQAAANYNAGKPKYDRIDSDETSIGEVWSATVTPNDGEQDGTTFESNDVTVRSSCNTPIYSTYWSISAEENCVISSPVDMGGNDISITGTGSFTTTADISNYGNLHIEGTDSSNKCNVRCQGGCFR